MKPQVTLSILHILRIKSSLQFEIQRVCDQRHVIVGFNLQKDAEITSNLSLRLADIASCRFFWTKKRIFHGGEPACILGDFTTMIRYNPNLGLKTADLPERRSNLGLDRWMVKKHRDIVVARSGQHNLWISKFHLFYHSFVAPSSLWVETMGVFLFREMMRTRDGTHGYPIFRQTQK
jgi:hypothetical protein